MVVSELGTQGLQYGCGLCAPEGWDNFDASPTLRIGRIPLVGKWLTRGRANFPASVRYGDVVKGIAGTQGRYDFVYCSHVLEHLSLEDFRIALRNTHRMLKPGGIFRFVLPDLRFYIENYLASQEDDAAKQFLLKTHLGQETRKRGVRGIVDCLLSNRDHRWMWDYPSIVPELSEAGFVNIRRAKSGDSGIAAFTTVENQGRWSNCLGVHCNRT